MRTDDVMSLNPDAPRFALVPVVNDRPVQFAPSNNVTRVMPLTRTDEALLFKAAGTLWQPVPDRVADAPPKLTLAKRVALATAGVIVILDDPAATAEVLDTAIALNERAIASARANRKPMQTPPDTYGWS